MEHTLQPFEIIEAFVEAQLKSPWQPSFTKSMFACMQENCPEHELSLHTLPVKDLHALYPVQQRPPQAISHDIAPDFPSTQTTDPAWPH